MGTYHKIPRVRTYFISMVPLILVTTAAPFLMCFQFPTGNEPVACLLTWQQKFNQSGLLLTYISAVFGVLSLYWKGRVDANRILAENQVAGKGRWLAELERVQQRSGAQDDNIVNCKKEIDCAQSQLDRANEFPKLLVVAAWAALLLVAIGTLLQVVGAGQVTANSSFKPNPPRHAIAPDALTLISTSDTTQGGSD